MPYKRIIARLDIKNHNVIKGIQMDGLRVIGPIQELARKYYSEGADEIIMIDVVASLYGREAMAKIIGEFTQECFVPVTVGGGVRNLTDADLLFRAGADKVAVNTGAISHPQLITDIAEKYGSQATVVHVDAKRNSAGGWEAYTESGRNPTGLDIRGWIQRAIAFGAGEILLTSVDKDGTRNGLDRDLISAVADLATVPLVVSGGAQGAADVAGILASPHLDGVAVGAALHYGTTTIAEVRNECVKADVEVREIDL